MSVRRHPLFDVLDSDAKTIQELERIESIMQKLQDHNFSYPGWLVDVRWIDQTLSNMSTIPESFLRATDFVRFFVNGLSFANVKLVSCVLGVIYAVTFKSEYGFSDFIDTNPVSYLVPMLSSGDLPLSAKAQILRLISTMIRTKGLVNYLLDTNTLQTIINVMHAPNVHVDIVRQVLILIDDFITASNVNDVAKILDIIIERVVPLWNSNAVDLAMFVLPVLSDLCACGFAEQLAQAFDIREVACCLGDERFRESYGDISRFLAQLLKFNPDGSQFIPCTWIFDELERANAGDRETGDLFALLTTIAENGLIMSLLEERAVSLLFIMITEREYAVRELALSFLWKGFASMKTIDEQVAMMESPLFPVMISELPSKKVLMRLLPIFSAIHNAAAPSEEALQNLKEFLDHVIGESSDPDVVSEAESVFNLYL